jgi:hypothetical protein
MGNRIDHELAKADKLIGEARQAPDERRSAELGREAIAELLGALLIEVGAIRDHITRPGGALE